jgi:hypothetical protein
MQNCVGMPPFSGGISHHMGLETGGMRGLHHSLNAHVM